MKAPGGVAIIGPGRLGQALGRLLKEAGVPILFVAGRNRKRAQRAAAFIGGGQAVRLDDPVLGKAGIFLITVSDSAVAKVAGEIAALSSSWRGKIALHTCGSLPANILNPLKRRGATTGSLHPYQTIPNPKAGVRNLMHCYWAIEGDARARNLAARWVKMLEGISFSIPPNRRTLYHLSAFLVCPTLVTLMDQSEKLLRKAGVPQGIIRPMLAQFVTETVKNFQELGAHRAMTGPVVRGDWATIRKHIAELRRASPEVLLAYRELLRLMARLARKAIPDHCLDVSK